MCGIAGIYRPSGMRDEDRGAIGPMTRMLAHRGPDGEGFHTSDQVLLGHRRLSIIDVSGGAQPMYNEDRSIAVTFNGEIFNYLELMDFLKAKGHRFASRCDTETIVHAYEEYGTECFSHFNGQWAIALWDGRLQRLILSRDRMGVRPLFYAGLPDGGLAFASEMKSLFCHPRVKPELDIAGLEQVFTLWANIPPSTVFRGVGELAPGSWMSADARGTRVHRFWKLSFPRNGETDERPLAYYSTRLRELLHDAVTLRLRADVPVAAYVSGGIDSSVIGALVRSIHSRELLTFSVAFADPHFDERSFQKLMVEQLQTNHRTVEATYDTIGASFGDVVWYAEKPLLRTAPGPLFLLSRLVRESNVKVVLTGEGADEILAGYDIFKEAAIRRFWSRQPQSRLRPRLLSRIYPDIPRTADTFWQQFFAKDLHTVGDPWYSHRIRWTNTAGIKGYLAEDIRASYDEERHVWSPLREYLDESTNSWHPLSRAQYLEASLFLPGYLLSSQGDRMMMGNSVEGRFPFLDYRVVEFCSTIPPRYKLHGMNEKFVLKDAFRDAIPQQILQRPKQPYRAPACRSLLSADGRVTEVLGEESVRESQLLDARGATVLRRRMQATGGMLGERESMAAVGMASLQWLHRHFLSRKHPFTPSTAA